LKTITALELAHWINSSAEASAEASIPKQKPIILDVREQWEWDLAHIDTSTHIPMGEITGRFGELDMNQAVVCVCHHGMRSMQVAMFLERQGFSTIFNLTGGIDAWSNHVDPSTARY
jgi:rhodanese-related sulfurtransferase